MLQSQRNFDRSCARYMPRNKPASRDFDDWDQDKLRLAMSSLDKGKVDMSEDNPVTGVPFVSDKIMRRIKFLMADHRWRTSTEIADRLDVSSSSVRKALAAFEENRIAHYETIDGIKTWNFGPKKKRVKRSEPAGTAEWKPTAIMQRILDAMPKGEWFRVRDLSAAAGLNNKTVSSSLHRMNMNGLVTNRPTEKTHFEWSKL